MKNPNRPLQELKRIRQKLDDLSRNPKNRNRKDPNVFKIRLGLTQVRPRSRDGSSVPAHNSPKVLFNFLKFVPKKKSDKFLIKGL